MTAASPQSSVPYSPPPYPAPVGSASLLLSFRPAGRVVLVVGANRLAASRVFACLDADLRVVVVLPSTDGGRGEDDTSHLLDRFRACDEIKYRITQNQARLRVVCDAARDWEELLNEFGSELFAVCVTETINEGPSSNSRTHNTSYGKSALSPRERASLLSSLCRARRIPLNVADEPSLCDFSFPATHRFMCPPPASSFSIKPGTMAEGRERASPLQIAVTTNGKGCRLAGRIRREIVSRLPRGVGSAVENVGRLREMAKREAEERALSVADVHGGDGQVEQITEKAAEAIQQGRLSSTKPQGHTADCHSCLRGDVEDDDVPLLTFEPLNSPVPQLPASASASRFKPGVLPPTLHASARTIASLSRSTSRSSSPSSSATPSTPMDGVAAGAFFSSSPSLSLGANTGPAQDKTGRAEPAVPSSEEEEESRAEARRRRMRWVAQVSEYWPIEYLARLGDSEEKLEEVLETYVAREHGMGGGLMGVGGNSTAPSLAHLHQGAAISGTVTNGTAKALESLDEERFRERTETSRVGGTEVCVSRGKAEDSQGSQAPNAGQRGASSTSQGQSHQELTSRERDSTLSSILPSSSSDIGERSSSVHALALALPPSLGPTRGKIYLLGSGTGHPSLLTLAAHRLLTSPTTSLILSDKLVPSSVLSLIPPTIRLHIAKKFPGNAEGAQNELMELALEAAMKGEVVVRLKQGDPFVYGRGGEEVLFFRQNGFEPVVVPGISSAFAGPLMAGIPVTQRGVADSLVLCTGVGRKGRPARLPGYERARTLVLLMGVARLPSLLRVLLSPTVSSSEQNLHSADGVREGAPYPSHLPVAIIERASSLDQRVVASTLSGIESALERAGEQRPPGMIVVGWAVLALEGEGNIDVLDEDGEGENGAEQQTRRDEERVRTWLGPLGYVVREGLVPSSEAWDALADVA